jgi:hypothetical protein
VTEGKLVSGPERREVTLAGTTSDFACAELTSVRADVATDDSL